MVQLKGAVVAPMVLPNHKKALPYAADPLAVTWNPEPANDGKSIVALQVLPFVVLAEVEGIDDYIELLWAPPSDSSGPSMTCATLIKLDEITAITRIIVVKEPSSLLLP